VAKRNAKHAKVKKDWIAFHKLHKTNFDDELGHGEKKQEDTTGHKKKGEKVQKTLTNEEWDALFLKMLKEDRVEVPEDFYEEDILFDEDEQLMEIYTYLEE
jgi:hypothetical protein